MLEAAVLGRRVTAEWRVVPGHTARAASLSEEQGVAGEDTLACGRVGFLAKRRPLRCSELRCHGLRTTRA